MATGSTRLVGYSTALDKTDIAPLLLQHATMAVLDNLRSADTAAPAFAAHIKSEIAKWAKVVKHARMRAD